MNKRIKELRQYFGLTQREFANKIGLKQNTIALIESGKRNTSEQSIIAICREFNVNKKWLQTGKGPRFVKQPEDTIEELQQEYGLDDFGYGLIYEYLKLDEKKRDAVRQYFYDVLSHDKANAPKKEDEDMDIDAMVEDYRQQLILEKKATEKSEALPKGS